MAPLVWGAPAGTRNRMKGAGLPYHVPASQSRVNEDGPVTDTVNPDSVYAVKRSPSPARPPNPMVTGAALELAQSDPNIRFG